MIAADAIERLQRRVDWLTKRIDGARGATQRLSFDEAERSALRFAIEHLKTCEEVKSETLTG